MNTTSLPSDLNQQNPGHSTKTLNENEPGWRELILSQDMESVWHRLAGLAQSQSSSQLDFGDKTQDVFLRLLSEQRLSTYVDENWSEAKIMGELLSLM